MREKNLRLHKLSRDIESRSRHQKKTTLSQQIIKIATRNGLLDELTRSLSENLMLR